MSGAILFIQEDLKITEVQQEVLVGVLSIISLLGSLSGGRTSDAIGRKWTMGTYKLVDNACCWNSSFSLYWSCSLHHPRVTKVVGLSEPSRRSKVGSNEYESEVEERLAEIQLAAGTTNTDKPVWGELLSPSPALRRMLITGIGIQCLQQITGIDATVYYSPAILKQLGIVDESKLLAATVAVLCAQASGLGAVGNRMCSVLMAMSFLSVSRAITVGGTFLIFSVISASSVAFVYKYVPETKGKSLEQIELLFQDEYGFQGGEVQLGDVEHLVQK
ncbi:hypothetical protein K7X08_027268 [Anisodus acutangulus]|uniref:Major facilitator superfamily (MFS) profile domain-containing protein n=1 Tax=Anisodus acutangulus TaxID=402998 RepID=A0A9Q1MM30_9SOLA|nr:hypothetical protein K7X08_027268 [Anisodus acutangulus]